MILIYDGFCPGRRQGLLAGTERPNRTVKTEKVALGELSLEALRSIHLDGDDPAAVVRQSIAYYLADRTAGRAAWLVPEFRRTEQPQGGEEVEFEIDEQAWESLTGAANRQGVTPERLVEHAILYVAADVDSGRVTQRILDDLDKEEAGEEEA